MRLYNRLGTHFIYVVYLPEERFSLKKKDRTNTLDSFVAQNYEKGFQGNVHSPRIFGFDFQKQETASGLLI